MQEHTVRKNLLVSGFLMIFLGCFIALLPPEKVYSYRFLVGFHLEYVLNGLLLIGLGLSTAYMQLPGSLWTLMCVSSHIGTWFNGLAFLIAALTGSASGMCSMNIAESKPDSVNIEGPYSAAATHCLLVTVVGLLPMLTIAMYGLLMGPKPAEKAKTQ